MADQVLDDQVVVAWGLDTKISRHNKRHRKLSEACRESMQMYRSQHAKDLAPWAFSELIKNLTKMVTSRTITQLIPMSRKKKF